MLGVRRFDQMRWRPPVVHCPVCGLEAPRCACREQLWTAADVAAYLRVHPKTVCRFVARRQLPCLRLGRRLRFRPLDVARWVAARLD